MKKYFILLLLFLLNFNSYTASFSSGESGEVSIDLSDSSSVDAFGNLRISRGFTIFDTKLNHSAEPEFWDDQEVSGSGTSSTHSSDRASSTMAVSNLTAGKRVRQTFARPNYQPGKSQKIVLTGIIGGSETGITREYGSFDDENGVFFRNDGGTISVVIKSFVTGSAVDTVYERIADWDDPMNGSGPSGIDLDFTNVQIFIIDFEWLGSGRVRFGFSINGKIFYCHKVNHANNIDSVYMSTPNNPIRASIENDGTGPVADFEVICTSVQSESGAQGTGVDYWYSTSGTHVDANVANSVYALLGIRLQTGHRGEPVVFRRSSVLIQSNDDFEWLLIRNPTVADTFTYNNVSGSGPFQIALGVTANTVTGGDVISGGFVSSGSVDSTEISYEGGFGEAIDGTRDEFVLCARPLSANADIEGGLVVQVNH